MLTIPRAHLVKAIYIVFDIVCISVSIYLSCAGFAGPSCL